MQRKCDCSKSVTFAISGTVTTSNQKSFSDKNYSLLKTIFYYPFSILHITNVMYFWLTFLNLEFRATFQYPKVVERCSLFKWLPFRLAFIATLIQYILLSVYRLVRMPFECSLLCSTIFLHIDLSLFVFHFLLLSIQPFVVCHFFPRLFSFLSRKRNRKSGAKESCLFHSCSLFTPPS